MLKEEEIRKKVKALKRFYMDIVNFVIINFVLVLIWWTFDKSGTFWPKYVIVVWGIALIFRAYRMGIMPFMFHRTSFLSDNWEEKKVSEMMRRRGPQHKIPPKRDEKKK
jgi:hypothetical protein